MSLKKSYSEQEMALVEMGSHLSNSQQKVEEMKEVTQSMKDMKWAEDKDAAQCQQCNQPFSLARRKHHCRNCGGIFCNSCSDYTMPLPSSAKPVRVCDSCYTTLLQRYQRWHELGVHVVSECRVTVLLWDVLETFREKNGFNLNFGGMVTSLV